jgi:hypothetical protein
MNAQNSIRDMLRREPFRPFRVVTSSGESYTIRNPKLVVPMQSSVFIALPDDCWTVILYLHVTALETISNGHPRRKRRA